VVAVVAVAAGGVDTAAVVAAVAAAVEGAAERPDISRVGLSRTGIPLARRILAAACPGFSASRKCGRGEDRQECLSYSDARVTALDHRQSSGLATNPAFTGLFSM